LKRLLDYRKPLIIVSQIGLLAMSYYCSFLLRFDFRPNNAYQSMCLGTMPLVITVELLMFYAFGLLRGWWRYVGMSDALDICEAAFISTAILWSLIELVLKVDGYPRSALAINLVLAVLFVGGTRFAVRAYTETAQHSAAELNTLIIFGGGAGGPALLHKN
jgi:UDP-GlcNAc:undecaprenyl-phosphate GlcNAc-1-phosphate transferase